MDTATTSRFFTGERNLQTRNIIAHVNPSSTTTSDQNNQVYDASIGGDIAIGMNRNFGGSTQSLVQGNGRTTDNKKRFKIQNTRFLDEMKEMWENKQLCDVVIKVGTTTFDAHRIILAMKSEYFKGLLGNASTINGLKTSSTQFPSCQSALCDHTNSELMMDTTNITMALPIVLVINDISSNDMEKLLRYCYTSMYDINSKNVQDTYTLADKYGFVGLLRRCVSYIENHIDVDNCLNVMHFARIYNCHILEFKAREFVWKNFLAVSEQSSEFLLLSSDSLADLLKSDELNVRSEERAFEAVLRWINYDPEVRQCHVLSLLRCVRLGLLDTQYFVEKVKQCEFIKNSAECRPLIRDVIRFLYDLRTVYDPKESQTNVNTSDKKGKGGPCRRAKNFLKNRIKIAEERKVRRMQSPVINMAPNGSLGVNIAALNATDDSESFLDDNDDQDENSVPGTRRNHELSGSIQPSMVTKVLAKPRLPHDIMFVIGGWSGGTPTNVVESYDTRADRWIRCENLESKEPRAYHGLVSLDHKMYMIGGFNGDEYFNTCKMLDPVRAPPKVLTIALANNVVYEQPDPWVEIAPMHSPRCYVSVAVLDGLIYAMGGFDGHARLNTAEKYDPLFNQWTPIFPMNHQRSDASSTVLNGKIYIAGGFNGQECLSTAESYDPLENTWNAIAPMKFRRSGVGVVTLHDKVYALGGFNGISRMSSVERYDPVTAHWEIMPDMNHPRSNFACEVIDEMIFVIGGFNGVSTIYHVECFNDTTNEWFDATDMNLYRSALSASVMPNLPNRYDFIHKKRDSLLEDKREDLMRYSRIILNVAS